MDEYTPSADEVRGYYAFGQIDPSNPSCPVRAEFDRWLAEVERAAAEKAWDEGEEAGYDDALSEQRGIGPHDSHRNPYRRDPNAEQ